ncbi:aspartate aminotransferase family protein [soil metagenome]
MAPTSAPEGTVSFPAHGRPAPDVWEALSALRGGDLDWRGGKAFSLVYHPAHEGLESLLGEVSAAFLHDNALNPFAYPSLLQMEAEVVAMAADLLGGQPAAGSMSSGGTESIFLAVHTAREHARQRGVERPTLLTAGTAHPAFAKAAHYLDLDHVRVPVGADLRADVAATAAAVDDRTALIVGSAPCYPYGVIDPIPDLAALAAEHEILCHVDACLGGWLLPFWERLGEPVPPWDLSVPGVTSLSADIHKYGWMFKGASVILYASRDLYRHQFFLYDDWPGGLYGSATTAGTRPAAPIAGAWTTINFLGADGYLALAGEVRAATRRFIDGVRAIDGLEITGDPQLPVFEFSGVDGVDIAAVADVMDDHGWHLDRQQGGLHLLLSPYHTEIADLFLADLAASVAGHGTSRGVEATYGGIAPERAEPRRQEAET